MEGEKFVTKQLDYETEHSHNGDYNCTNLSVIMLKLFLSKSKSIVIGSKN
jgi:hypothetical protein